MSSAPAIAVAIAPSHTREALAAAVRARPPRSSSATAPVAGAARPVRERSDPGPAPVTDSSPTGEDGRASARPATPRTTPNEKHARPPRAGRARPSTPPADGCTPRQPASELRRPAPAGGRGPGLSDRHAPCHGDALLDAPGGQLQVASGADVGVEYPLGWNETGQGPGDPRAHPQPPAVAACGARGEPRAGLEAGSLPGTAPEPPAAGDPCEAPELPRVEVVSLAALQALRYPDVRLAGYRGAPGDLRDPELRPAARPCWHATRRRRRRHAPGAVRADRRERSRSPVSRPLTSRRIPSTHDAWRAPGGRGSSSPAGSRVRMSRGGELRRWRTPRPRWRGVSCTGRAASGVWKHRRWQGGSGRPGTGDDRRRGRPMERSPEQPAREAPSGFVARVCAFAAPSGRSTGRWRTSPCWVTRGRLGASGAQRFPLGAVGRAEHAADLAAGQPEGQPGLALPGEVEEAVLTAAPERLVLRPGRLGDRSPDDGPAGGTPRRGGAKRRTSGACPRGTSGPWRGCSSRSPRRAAPGSRPGEIWRHVCGAGALAFLWFHRAEELPCFGQFMSSFWNDTADLGAC